MFIGIMQNLPELIGGLAFGALTWMTSRWTALMPVIGSRKIKQQVGMK